MATFPSRHLLAADATLDETAELRAEFERSDIGTQDGLEAFYRGLSVSGLREHLGNLRAAGHFGKTPEAPDPAAHLRVEAPEPEEASQEPEEDPEAPEPAEDAEEIDPEEG